MVAYRTVYSNTLMYTIVASVYDPTILVWIDESGYDKKNSLRKYAYSLK